MEALKCLSAGLFLNRADKEILSTITKEAEGDSRAITKRRKLDAEIEELKTDEDVRLYRKKKYINVYSRTLHKKDKNHEEFKNVPKPVQSIEELKDRYSIPEWLFKIWNDDLKFTSFTNVQQQAIPCFFEKHPLLVSAPTGSGKTFAFLIPIVTELTRKENDRTKGTLQSLVIVPSRELAIQIVGEFESLTKNQKIKGGTLFKDDFSVDFAACTPLRLVWLLEEKKISFKSLKILILDEADRLLDDGFAPQIDKILTFVDLKTCYLALFSATLPENVVLLAGSLMPAATRISVGRAMSAADSIEQELVFVTKEAGKLSTFRQLLSDGKLKLPILVFMQSIERAAELERELRHDKIHVRAMHADQSKEERQNTMEAFKSQKTWVLVCTDLLCRGVDFPSVNTVVNWDLPQSAASYIHRIGRTGRAGQKGKAITFFGLDDVTFLPLIVNVMKQSGCDVPEWMLKLKKPRRQEKKKFQRHGISRKPIVGRANIIRKSKN